MVSGMVTSREIFSRGPLSWMRARSRSRRRRIEASDRARSVSSSALETVSLPRRRSSPTRLAGLGSGARGVLMRPRSAAPGRSSSSVSTVSRPSPGQAAPRPRGSGALAVVGFCSLLAETAAGGFLGAGCGPVSSALWRASSSAWRRAASACSLATRSASAARRAAASMRRLALLGLVRLGVGEGAGAGIDLVGRQLAQDQAGARAGIGGVSVALPAARPRDAGRPRRCSASGGARVPAAAPLGLLLARQDDAALLALDLHRIGAAVREALPDGVPFDAALQAERALGHADRLFVGRFAHAFLSSCTQGTRSIKGVDCPAASAVRGARYHGNGRDRESAPADWRSPARQAAQHVSHLFGQKPNPNQLAVKAADDGQPAGTEAPARRRIELGDAVGAGFGGVNQRRRRRRGRQRRLDLGETADKLPALRARERAPVAAACSRRSTRSARPGSTRAPPSKARVSSPFRSAVRTCAASAVTQTPRPGSRRRRSATTVPSGATTKRISASTGKARRVTTQVRSVGALRPGTRVSPSQHGRRSVGGGFRFSAPASPLLPRPAAAGPPR